MKWLTAVLHAENPDLDWTIPKQGALLWAQSIGGPEGSCRTPIWRRSS
ncbi:MAG: hypothetical protein R3D61_05475 [Defluviimonas denitrificans]